MDRIPDVQSYQLITGYHLLNSIIVINKNHPFGVVIDKSGRADLNRRPHGPEPCTLSGLSHAPNCLKLYLTEPRNGKVIWNSIPIAFVFD